MANRRFRHHVEQERMAAALQRERGGPRPLSRVACPLGMIVAGTAAPVTLSQAKELRARPGQPAAQIYCGLARLCGCRPRLHDVRRANGRRVAEEAQASPRPGAKRSIRLNGDRSTNRSLPGGLRSVHFRQSMSSLMASIGRLLARSCSPSTRAPAPDAGASSRRFRSRWDIEPPTWPPGPRSS